MLQCRLHRLLEKGAESGVKSALLTQTMFLRDSCGCFVGEVGVPALCRPEPSTSLQPLPTTVPAGCTETENSHVVISASGEWSKDR